MTTGEVLVIIAAIGTMLVSVINAMSAGWGRQATRESHADLVKRSDSASIKLDKIHILADGNLSRVSDQLSTALNRIERLETLLQDAVLAKQKAQLE